MESERKAALTAARAVWNQIVPTFNDASDRLVAVPELKPVLDLFKAVSDVGQAGKAAFKAAIDETEKLEPTPAPSAADTARLDRLNSDMAALLRSFESDSGREVLAVVLTRDAVSVVS